MRNVKRDLKQLLQEEDVQKWAFGEPIATSVATVQAVYIKSLEKELEHLRDRSPYFGSYNCNNIEMAIEMGEDVLRDAITEHTPLLSNLLTILCQDRRTASPQTNSRIATIIQVMCFNRNQRKGNFFPAVMGMVMHSRGVSKPVFKVLNSMGITESYDSAMRAIEGLRHSAISTISQFAGTLQWLIAYDNLDITIDTHEQTTES